MIPKYKSLEEYASPIIHSYRENTSLIATNTRPKSPSTMAPKINLLARKEAIHVINRGLIPEPWRTNRSIPWVPPAIVAMCTPIRRFTLPG